MQAFPFMVIGILVSSAIHIFIPDEWIIKVFPTRYGLGFLTALLAGALFPICECVNSARNDTIGQKRGADANCGHIHARCPDHQSDCHRIDIGRLPRATRNYLDSSQPWTTDCAGCRSCHDF